MIVVSDTSPLSALLAIEQADLLPKLFKRVLIPPTVRGELLRHHDELPVFLEVIPAQNQQALNELRLEIAAGEAEAIVLAGEQNADYLLIDERLGTSVALRRGQQTMGMVGVLIRAKDCGHITSLREQLDLLEKKTSFYLSSAFRKMVLEKVDE